MIQSKPYGPIFCVPVSKTQCHYVTEPVSLCYMSCVTLSQGLCHCVAGPVSWYRKACVTVTGPVSFACVTGPVSLKACLSSTSCPGKKKYPTQGVNCSSPREGLFRLYHVRPTLEEELK